MGKQAKQMAKLLKASDALAAAAYRIIAEDRFYGDDINDLVKAYRWYCTRKHECGFLVEEATDAYDQQIAMAEMAKINQETGQYDQNH